MGTSSKKSPLEPGVHYLMGDEACAEAALAAGCRFYAGYPITPASEVMERMAEKLAAAGGSFIQMEDEIGSMAAVVGASWAGMKAMTATSGPGLSLMMENIGYAAMTETPCVVVDIQRAGPATGQATRIGSGDVLQIKWGSHGDYETVALSPWSVQEIYDFTIKAFNLSEQYRVPAFVMSDEGVGHLREGVNIAPQIEVFDREPYSGGKPFDSDLHAKVPPMPIFGNGHRVLVTGSTHDGWGFRKTQDPQVHERLVSRLNDKIRLNARDIIDVESHFLDGGVDILVVAYGFTARAAIAAVKLLRAEGTRAGLLRLRTLWPFPDDAIAEAAHGCRRVVVPELNRGQICREVQRVSDVEVLSVPQTDGCAMKPDKIVDSVRRLK